MSTGPFPKILHLGDKQISDLLSDEVEITEKVDGSQLGFGKVNGRLFVRSKGRELDLDTPDGMFMKAVEYVKTIENNIPDNTTFYGEYLSKPKHNTLAYDRVPRNNIALYGVYDYVTKVFGDYEEIENWADKLDVDAVKLLHKGEATSEGILTMVKNTVSQLGGQNIEGVVVKAYKPWLFLGQIPLTVMAGKYVTEEFKEVHNNTWKAEHTNKGQLEMAVSKFRSEARWNKGVQHLRDDGTLTGTPKDIGALFKNIRQDVETEEKENIKDILWAIYKENFLKESVNGLPQWYKEKLVMGELNGEEQVNQEPQEVVPEDAESDTKEGRQLVQQRIPIQAEASREERIEVTVR